MSFGYIDVTPVGLSPCQPAHLAGLEAREEVPLDMPAYESEIS
jgi:hypothetical protein